MSMTLISFPAAVDIQEHIACSFAQSVQGQDGRDGQSITEMATNPLRPIDSFDV
jgi:cell pole-organizing protein PopZ